MSSCNRIIWTALAAASIAAAQPDPPDRVGRLDYVQGPVSFQPAGVDDWVSAIVNRPMTTGDQLWVDQNGRAEMHIGSAAMRLGASTSFEFLNLSDDVVQIRLAQGSLEVRLRFLDDNQSFEVDTPNLAFSLLRPGIYRIDANPDAQATIVTVRSGQGEGTGGGIAIPVHPGEQARISGDQQLAVDIAAAPPPDWFDGWCSGRDRRWDTSLSARYVSRDIIGYEDLDTAGEWRPAGDYGTVWFPRVDSGWAPYRFGHWAWIDPWGWTWVDDAAWGFAPFHYGRWAYVGGGWGWIPGPVAQHAVYAPALVAWVGGSGFSLAIGGGGGMAGIGWFPLGPREVFVPSYHVSPVYVNRVNVSNTTITNINVTNINVTNVRYVNQSAPNGVTAVTRETFVNAQPVGRAVVPVRAEMLAHAQVSQNTQFAPSRQAVLGHPTISASTSRPPAAVVNRQVMVRATPPPAVIPFAQRERLLQQNPGRPLDAAQIQQVRAQNPAPAPRQMVRPVVAPPGMGAGRQASPPVVERPPTSQPPQVSPQTPRPQENIRPPAPQFNNPGRPQEVRPPTPAPAPTPAPQELRRPTPPPETNPAPRPNPQLETPRPAPRTPPSPEINKPITPPPGNPIRPANPEVKPPPPPKPEERRVEPASRPAPAEEKAPAKKRTKETKDTKKTEEKK